MRLSVPLALFDPNESGGIVRKQGGEEEGTISTFNGFRGYAFFFRLMISKVSKVDYLQK